MHVLAQCRSIPIICLNSLLAIWKYQCNICKSFLRFRRADKKANENTNWLLREFYPKGMDLSKVNKDELVYHLTIMND